MPGKEGAGVEPLSLHYPGVVWTLVQGWRGWRRMSTCQLVDSRKDAEREPLQRAWALGKASVAK